MSELVHADIFFFITSTAVILITAGILVLLFYIIPIARDIRAMVASIRKASEDVEKDFEALRANVREEGAKGKALIDLGFGFLMRKLTPRPHRTKKPSAETHKD